MARHFILAQSEVTARALGAWLELIGEPELEVNGKKIDDPRVLWSDELPSQTSKHLLVQRLIRKLDLARQEAAPEPAIVLVDAVRPSGLNALSTNSSWESVLASLILALPEIRWVFGTISQEGEKKDNRFPKNWHNLPSLFKPDFDPLFDGSGLRQFVRDNREDDEAEWIPSRRKWALAMDEEPIFAYLHGYIAYRFGFRAFPVHTYRLADHLLAVDTGKTKDEWASGLGPPALTLEDLYLGFPDRPDKGSSAEHLANLKERTKKWQVLNHEPSSAEAPNMPWRYFISSGHTQSGGVENVEVNEEVCNRLSDNRRGGRKVDKPISGIFALWQKLNLFKRLPYPNGSARADESPGYAPGFIWPPKIKENNQTQNHNHSAPGQLLIIADSLIERATTLIYKTDSVQEAVRGAVLANSALEILGPKTPTTAREALELKHRFEVLAECQFGGIQYNIDVEDRFKEIRRDVALLGRWYGHKGRANAVRNAELTIISRLRGIFRDNDEFDEENQCLKYIRDLQRNIWCRNHPFSSILIWPIRIYLETLVGSFRLFLTASLTWLLGITGVIYLHLGKINPEGAENLAGASWQTAATAFFGGELSFPDDLKVNFWVGLVTTFGIVFGFIHLGILISRLYDFINRR